MEGKRLNRVDFGAVDHAEDGALLMIAHFYLYRMDTKLPWLGICIRDGYMGRHLGRTFIDCMEQYVKERQCGGLCLITHAANIRGQVLYRNCGFQNCGTAPNGEFLFIKPFSNQ